MPRIALTGGIGSGKTTVARHLVERGAVLVDADQLARDVVKPGTPGLAAIRERGLALQFGGAVVGGGSLWTTRRVLRQQPVAEGSIRRFKFGWLALPATPGRFVP